MYGHPTDRIRSTASLQRLKASVACLVANDERPHSWRSTDIVQHKALTSDKYPWGACAMVYRYIEVVKAGSIGCDVTHRCGLDDCDRPRIDIRSADSQCANVGIRNINIAQNT